MSKKQQIADLQSDVKFLNTVVENMRTQANEDRRLQANLEKSYDTAILDLQDGSRAFTKAIIDLRDGSAKTIINLQDAVQRLGERVHELEHPKDAEPGFAETYDGAWAGWAATTRQDGETVDFQALLQRIGSLERAVAEGQEFDEMDGKALYDHEQDLAALSDSITDIHDSLWRLSDRVTVLEPPSIPMDDEIPEARGTEETVGSYFNAGDVTWSNVTASNCPAYLFIGTTDRVKYDPDSQSTPTVRNPTNAELAVRVTALEEASVRDAEYTLWVEEQLSETIGALNDLVHDHHQGLMADNDNLKTEIRELGKKLVLTDIAIGAQVETRRDLWEAIGTLDQTTNERLVNHGKALATDYDDIKELYRRIEQLQQPSISHPQIRWGTDTNPVDPNTYQNPNTYPAWHPGDPGYGTTWNSTNIPDRLNPYLSDAPDWPNQETK